MTQTAATHDASLKRYLSPLAVWALALGSAVGWGSFVMPGNTFLPLAGPMGTAIGLVLGAVIMLVVGVNYHYLMNRYPGSGGTFSYASRCFGYDQGFLAAWFLLLTYVAIIWANATALPLIGRSLLGSTFQFGPSYEIAGYRVFFGEVIVVSGILLLAFAACLKGRPAAAVQVILAIGLCACVFVCFASVISSVGNIGRELETNPFGDRSALAGVFNMMALAPWAYVGFESISHSEREFTFSPKKSFACMAAALVVGCALYVILALQAASVQPDGYNEWAGYIADLGNKTGYESVPTFFAAHEALGKTGLVLMGIAALCGIGTGLIGNLVAASRLLLAMAQEKLLPAWFVRINNDGTPAAALLFVTLVSLPMPFFGRTAISWIVDVTTVGAVIAYGYTSACAYKAARIAGDKNYTHCGAIGVGISCLFMLVYLVPNILAVSVLSVESYLILASWSILGLMFFRQVFKHDKEHRLGHSTVAWVVLLSLILFTSLTWVRQSSSKTIGQAQEQLEAHWVEALGSEGQVDGASDDSSDFLGQQMGRIKSTINLDTTVQIGLVVLSLIFMFDIYSIMQKREKQLELDKVLAEESSRAKTSFLSNMSHEIRTPMNAIIGLDNIALKDPDLNPRTRDQLEKIGSSAQHLLGLINDILDMSRIESGRMVLKQEDFSFRDFLDQINVMVGGQCQDKGLDYECQMVGRADDYYVGDDMKLKQVLINILGNAVKFTNEGGRVTLRIEQVGSFEGYRTLRFSISDTGIGMDEEYIPKIFEAFSQEDASTVNRYGGSGLGMAITKNIVEMMNGEIEVESEKGVGTTFNVTVTLRASSLTAHDGPTEDLHALRALVVDDDEVACEHAQLVLSGIGIQSERCMKSADGLALMHNAYDMGKPYHLLLTDYLMPGMDGGELVKAVRAFDNNETIIVVLTGYSVDDVSAAIQETGADGLLSKPLFSDTLTREIRTALLRHESLEEVLESEAVEVEEGYVEGSLEGKRILLAEDIQINADIMMDLLDMEGIEAEHALNGQLAVEMFEESDPDYFDAVLMDVRMPVMDGLTAASEIRKLTRDDAHVVPIIALTANAFDEDVQRSLQAGMNAHLSKPVEPERLYETLTSLIAEREQKASAS